MSHPPRAGMCQGNFAATVKEILPIDECGVLVTSNSIEHFPQEFPRIRGNSSLTGRYVWRN
jgi:hypothetical protein